MAATFDSARLRHQRRMDQRLTADHRALGRAIAALVLRAASGRNDAGEPIIPATRASRDALKAAAWEQVLKPYYIGQGTDALRGASPQSPYAQLLVDGITEATRIQVLRQVALVRRLVKDPVVLQWLTGPRSPLAVKEINTIGVGIPATPSPTRATPGSATQRTRRVDVSGLVQPRGMYEPFHTWVDPNGYRLSDRVWRTSIEVRSRVDRLVDYHISQGTSAVRMANLLEPFLTPGALLQKTQTPYGSEGSYAARRLARTEITAAAGRASINAASANPFVDSMQWRLSGSHPKIDICDQYARGGPNGDGIYPLGEVPAYPPHPFCLCGLLPVPRGSTADLVKTLRDDIQAARTSLLGSLGGSHARALQGILNPNYLTRAILSGNLDEAVQAAVIQARTLPVAAAPVPIAPAPRPAPVPTPAGNPLGAEPLGTPVSQALKIPTSGPHQAAYQEALDAIDAVHGDGKLPKLPVTTDSRMESLGEFRFLAGTGEPLEIVVNGKGSHRQLTLAHEIGHFLDYQGIGKPGRAESMERGLFNEWRKAVSASKAVETLREKRKSPSRFVVKTTLPSGTTYVAKPDSYYLLYTLDEKEIWARSYAQYIAVRSGNPTMLAQLAKERLDPVYSERQWDDEDFAPIAAAIDALFRRLGWLR